MIENQSTIMITGNNILFPKHNLVIIITMMMMMNDNESQ